MHHAARRRFHLKFGLVAACSFAFVPHGAADAPIFGGAVFVAASDPESVETIDLNGDGHLDLVIASSVEIVVLLGDGDGAFTQFQSIVGGDAGLVIRDVTDDDIPDLIVGSSDTCAVRIFAGQGDGAFGEAIPLPAGCGPASVTVADFNDDNIQDIATTDYESQSISLLFGVGAGEFAPVQSIKWPISVGLSSIASADIDNDDDIDLVTIGGSSMTVHFNDGDGDFSQNASFGAGANARSLQLGDLNNDGRIDAVVANDALNRLSILRQFTPGSFLPPQALAAGSRPERIRLGDLDGDGDLDIAVAHPSTLAEFDDPEPEGAIGLFGGEVRVFRNNGSSAFSNSDRFFAGAWPRGFAFGDFDEDGHIDIATVSRAAAAESAPFLTKPEGAGGDPILGYVSIAFGRGEARFASPDRVVTAGASRIKLSDIDHDGDPDLVEGRNFGYLIRRNTGDGHFETLVGGANTTGLPLENPSFELALIDDDLNPDIVTASSEGVKIAFGNGAGFFSPFNPIEPGFFRAVQTLDFNGDLITDIVAGERREDESDLFVVLRGDGFGSFTRVAEATIPEDPFGIVAADFNGDAVPDAAIAGRESAMLSIATLTASGDVVAIQNLPLPGMGYNLRVSDLDGDGDRDLIIAIFNASRGVVILENNGAGEFSFVDFDADRVRTPDVEVADFNFDGAPDILVADAVQDRLHLYLNEKTGEVLRGFTRHSSIVAGDYPRSLAAGDLDGDDRVDVVVAAQKPEAMGGEPNAFNSIMVYFNIATGAAIVGDLTGEGVVGAADLAVLLQQWGPCPPKGPCPADLNVDGSVDGFDLAVLLTNWS